MSKFTDVPVVKNTLVNQRPTHGTPFVAPYIPSATHVVKAALEFASITSSDVLADLGCGDGRILVSACQLSEPPQRVIGVELDPGLVQYACRSLTQNANGVPWQILEKDMFDIDLEEFDVSVVILYLLPTGLTKLKTQLAKWLKTKPDARIVTVNYSMPGWEPKKGVEIRETGVSHWMFYYDDAQNK